MVVLFHRGWMSTSGQSISVSFPISFMVFARNFKYMVHTWAWTFCCGPIIPKFKWNIGIFSWGGTELLESDRQIYVKRETVEEWKLHSVWNMWHEPYTPTRTIPQVSAPPPPPVGRHTIVIHGHSNTNWLTSSISGQCGMCSTTEVHHTTSRWVYKPCSPAPWKGTDLAWGQDLLRAKTTCELCIYLMWVACMPSLQHAMQQLNGPVWCLHFVFTSSTIATWERAVIVVATPISHWASLLIAARGAALQMWRDCNCPHRKSGYVNE